MGGSYTIPASRGGRLSRARPAYNLGRWEGGNDASPNTHITMVAINSTYRPRDLTINGQRLNDTLHQTCEFGAAHRWGAKATETGMARLALTDSDKAVRDWYVAEMKSLGCEVKIDTMGNIFAIRAGENDGPPTAMGSHLDTQPTGGRYDGILGVMAAVEAMRTLHESGRKTKYPVAAIDWTNEEGGEWLALWWGIADGSPLPQVDAGFQRLGGRHHTRGCARARRRDGRQGDDAVGAPQDRVRRRRALLVGGEPARRALRDPHW